MIPVVGLLVSGLVLLVAGGELLVRGASRLAAAIQVPPLVIGLTVVAFGTSAPELAVSLDAGLRGTPDIAVGNVVGSNIFNTLCILGACALILPLVVSVQLVRREVPIMVAVSLLLYGLARDGQVGPVDGALLGTGLIAYTGWSIVSGRREARLAARAGLPAGSAAENAAPADKQALRAATAAVRGWQGAALLASAVATVALWAGWVAPVPALVLLAGALTVFLTASRTSHRAALANQAGHILGGLGLLMLGAEYLVGGATSIARAFGVSDLVIGLTIVAAGTSLPEVATSITATLRGERDIAIGNVVGSNIFNVLGILGISALVTPGGLPVHATVVAFDLPVMMVTAVACLPIFFTGFRVGRAEGALFLAGYIAYTVAIVGGVW